MKFKPLTPPSSFFRPEYRDSFFNVFDTVLDELWSTNAPDSPVLADLNYPKYNAYKTGNGIGANHQQMVVDIAVPYVKLEDVSLFALDNENALRIEVATHQGLGINEKDYFIKQIPRGSWRQTFTFDKQYPVQNASADLKDGILTIKILSKSKSEQTTSSRRIKIG